MVYNGNIQGISFKAAMVSNVLIKVKFDYLGIIEAARIIEAIFEDKSPPPNINYEEGKWVKNLKYPEI